jgi:glycosyltransferase involved in cell wall biosynthesis
VIIPAYNEERRLPASLPRVAAFVQAQPYEVEVIVVDDGSQDATASIVEEYTGQYPFIHLIRNAHGGKGAAVRAGIARGCGQYLIISDTDLAVPIEELPKFLPPRLDGYDLAIASREVEGARRFNEPYYRHLMGRVYNLLVRVIAVPRIQDTQCGFKAFHLPVARQIFCYQTIDGWGSTWVLFIARQRLHHRRSPGGLVLWRGKQNPTYQGHRTHGARAAAGPAQCPQRAVRTEAWAVELILMPSWLALGLAARLPPTI